jgi:hypothetical protein
MSAVLIHAVGGCIEANLEEESLHNISCFAGKASYFALKGPRSVLRVLDFEISYGMIKSIGI